jgi:hypothetical protein
LGHAQRSRRTGEAAFPRYGHESLQIIEIVPCHARLKKAFISNAYIVFKHPLPSQVMALLPQ